MARYRKTYMTRANEARIPLQLGDVMVDAHFHDGNIRDNEWATLETTDSLVQFVIESSPLYGKRILLKSSVLLEEPKEEVEMKPEDVTTLEEARQYLVKNFGVDRRSISAPNAIKSVMKGRAIEFPNLKI